jgi:hypothetical protein
MVYRKSVCLILVLITVTFSSLTFAEEQRVVITPNHLDQAAATLIEIQEYKTILQQTQDQLKAAKIEIKHNRKMFDILAPTLGFSIVAGAVVASSCALSGALHGTNLRLKNTCLFGINSFILADLAAGEGTAYYSNKLQLNETDKLNFELEVKEYVAELSQLQGSYKQLKQVAQQ